MEESINTKSEFNSAISVMNKMNHWFFCAEEAQVNADYHGWYKYLLNNHLLLYSDMKTEDKTKSTDFRNLLNAELVKISGKKIIFTDTLDKFINWHLLLMDVFKYAGYKTKSESDPYSAIR